MSKEEISLERARQELEYLQASAKGSEEKRRWAVIMTARRLRLIDFPALSNFVCDQFPGAADDVRKLRREMMCKYVHSACDAYISRRGIYPTTIGQLFDLIKSMGGEVKP